jgi:hypothetical protein
MKLYCVAIADKNNGGKPLAAEYDLSSFGFFQRGRYVVNISLNHFYPIHNFTWVFHCLLVELVLSFWVRSIQEAMNFAIKTITERTNPGVRQKIEEEGDFDSSSERLKMSHNITASFLIICFTYG